MRLVAAATVFVAAFFAFAFFFLAAPVIPDADSYFHLAVAREYASHGYMDALPWTRFSILGKTYGDKELLFHYLLAPFASWTDAATGGRLALALLNATFAATMTFFAARALGWWSLAVPLWLYVSAPMLTFRLIRLRPELLALLLLLAFIHAAASRRVRWVAVLAAVFALSYTAFHVIVGLPVLWFLGVRRQSRRSGIPLAATLGAAAGLLVHPGFPDNLRIWWIQNVLFFVEKSRLDVGSEIEAAPLHFLLLLNLGWWAGIAVLWFFSRGATADRRRIVHFGVAAAVFAVLTLLLQRMAIYFVPLLTLVLLARLEAIPDLRRARVALALLATAVLSLPASSKIARELFADSGWEADYAAFGKAVPPGAKVAAHWGPAEMYCFWAPQGRYLNVLDPIFAEAYDAQRRVFEGREPDVPRVVHTTLDSDYIAFPSTSPLFERLQHDPRIVPIHNGLTFLGRIAPERTQDFVGGGYIPAAPRCTSIPLTETLTAPETRTYELASYGPAELRIDDRPPIRTRGSRAILGRGAFFRTTLAAGAHRFVVTTCPARDGGNGFYLLRRSAVGR
ncbi:MAG TPA: hypothetical protein VGD79_06640 [Thermoanaerobaculia bacterium]